MMATHRGVIPNSGMKSPRFEKFEPPSLAELELDDWPVTATPADALFTTSTQRRLLGLLYGQPELEFHTGQLIEITGSGAGATHRELRRLEQAGLLRSRTQCNRKYHQANRGCSIYRDLVAIVRNTFGLVEPLRMAFGSIAHYVDVAFVFDAFDQELSTRPMLEMLIVSKSPYLTSEGIDFGIDFAQRRLHRGLRVLEVRPEELQRPRWFIQRALAQPRTWIFGDEGMLEAMTSGP